jgi:rhamnose transport system ATP-binding protein
LREASVPIGGCTRACFVLRNSDFHRSVLIYGRISPAVLLRASAMRKSYAGVRALDDVTFALEAGEVHAIVGENGAGKSTLIKIFTGAVAADAGTIEIDGRPAGRLDPHAARALGIAAIYQQPALFPSLTVAENIALALEHGSVWRRIDWDARSRRARELLETAGASIDPARLVETLSMPEQQMVEIAKAIGADARVVIMDEPTASLTDREVDALLGVVRRLRDRGVGVIYISHRLEEVFAIADRITVLRDGRTVGMLDAHGVDRARIVRMMVGRELSAVFPKRDVAIGGPALEARGIGHRASGIHDVSFTVHEGEILGIAGLVGSGRTELAEILFGLRPADDGELRLRGVPVSIASPQDAIARGIGYVPEDRRHHGIILPLSIAMNASLADLDRISRAGLIDADREHAAAARLAESLRIKAPSVDAPVETLSGGNQQKVALARWLATEPAVLILDEPTQGVDVGSKAEIHELMTGLARRGLAIVMISSELPEILGMSDRIAVMRAGRLRRILSREHATQANILELALGEGTYADEADRNAAGEV